MGTTRMMSSRIATAEASGQSRLEKNSLQSCRPIIRVSEPPRRSGITNSPTAGMKHRSEPATMPGMASGTVIVQNARHGVEPRSSAASISVSSIFSSVA